MKKNELTLEKFKEIIQPLYEIDQKEHIIKRWQYPFLWLLWFFIGRIEKSEGFTFYILDFRKTRYLLRSIDPIT